ncbi:unnamed protein product [Nippostrongylus brasiliensis]|uniref:DNA-directed DNA polymerase n=1 Tax=Nippostrongylus brasiliensis TaxID=27835 RepID=A0A0N4YT19_NIPBR|nr:unnamed protein product [Nippostrongylus brasiliensis]
MLQMSTAGEMSLEEIQNLILGEPMQVEQLSAIMSMMERLIGEVDKIGNKGSLQAKEVLSAVALSLSLVREAPR